MAVTKIDTVEWTRVVYRAPNDPDPDTLPPDGIRVDLVRFFGDPVWIHLRGTVRSYNDPGFTLPGTEPKRYVSVDIHDGVAGSAWFGVHTPPDDWPAEPADGVAADWWRPVRESDAVR